MTLHLIILALGTSLHCMKMHHISRQLDNLCIEFCWRQRIVKHHLWTGLSVEFLGSVISAQRVPEPDPLPGIYFDTRPDPIQF